jgi:hypothetical protein
MVAEVIRKPTTINGLKALHDRVRRDGFIRWSTEYLIPNNTKRKQNICGGLNRIGNKA